MVSLVSDIIIGLSAAFVAAIAFLGLSTWRKELAGKARFELARSIMLLGLKLEADLHWIRHPLSRAWEFADRKPKENESEQEKQVLNEWYVRSGRLRLLAENLQKLQELGLEAEVMLDEESGKQVSEAIQAFRQCYVTLSSAIESYFEIRHQEVVTGDKYNDQEWLEGLRKEIYPPTDDEVSKKVREAKDQLACVLRKYVR